MSDTPRTDAALEKLRARPSSSYGSADGGWDAHDVFAMVEHSRQLERELTAALAERDAARECLREAIQYAEAETDVWPGLERLNRWRAAAGLEGK